MTYGHSFLVYAPTFCPLDHWRRVLPGVHLYETSASLPTPCQGNTLWICSDAPDWQGVSQNWSRSGSRVVVLTREPRSDEMNLALASGARAYVPALANSSVFRQVAESVGSGGLWLPENLLGNLLQLVSNALDHAANSRVEADLSVLTTREKEVARQASKGASNRRIAETLGITERTVKEHMGSVFRKLGVRDRMQLMLFVTGQPGVGGGDDVHQA
ncbi:response regulator transcription factor [Marinobacter sp. 2_MG-2023]|uniref:helix-turn-helix transcriptional regulator n=1 Tax=Marinobacter sp. 2_MG-2023 TaxID=3062679 RepID=UPI0026E3C7F2|nr:response regulator transcription factor [Marinobacter sp. 2_MG-2023]MDO6441352.1 response regulator transcription factor [Marinobacter sp. 2_MG-2023]